MSIVVFKNTFFVGGVVILLLMGAGCTAQSATRSTGASDVVTLRNPGLQSTLASGSTAIVYRNPTLHVAFAYPKVWGRILQETDGDDHIALSVFEKSNIFLAADTGGPSVPRGAYWGDDAATIVSQDFINNFCVGKINCVVKKNAYDITFAKWVDTTPGQGIGQPRTQVYYYLYNPKSEFRGVILSADRLGLRSEKIKNAEKTLDQIVDGLHFID